MFGPESFYDWSSVAVAAGVFLDTGLVGAAFSVAVVFTLAGMVFRFVFRIVTGSPSISSGAPGGTKGGKY